MKNSSEGLEESYVRTIATFGQMKAPNVYGLTLKGPSTFSLVFRIPVL